MLGSRNHSTELKLRDHSIIFIVLKISNIKKIKFAKFFTLDKNLKRNGIISKKKFFSRYFVKLVEIYFGNYKFFKN